MTKETRIIFLKNIKKINRLYGKRLMVNGLKKELPYQKQLLYLGYQPLAFSHLSLAINYTAQ